jgi:hypothetical protein
VITEEATARHDQAGSTAVSVLLAMLADDDSAARSALEEGQVFDTPDDAQTFVAAMGKIFIDLARRGYRGDDEQIRDYLRYVGRALSPQGTDLHA